jgi:hypothetical protein
MATRAQATPQTNSERNTRALLALIVGWIIPGGGHLLQRRWLRGALIFIAIATLFFTGLAMGGKIYVPNTGELLDMLGFVGDLGAAGLYALARIAGWGDVAVQVVTADYGTKFIVVAGLLNIVAAVDAHGIAMGKKA